MVGGAVGPGQGHNQAPASGMQRRHSQNRRVLGPMQRSSKAGPAARGEGGTGPNTSSHWTERPVGQPGAMGLDGPTSSLIQSIMAPQGSPADNMAKMHGKPGASPGRTQPDIDHSTMHNSSLLQPSHDLTGGGSIESTIVAGTGVGQASPGGLPTYPSTNSPKLPVLPRKGSRNVYMQKKGLVLNDRDLSHGAVGPGAAGRNPFSLHTDRAKNSVDDYVTGTPGVRGVGLVQPSSRFDSSTKKATSINVQQAKSQHRNAQNPFSGAPTTTKQHAGALRGDQRPDSMISGGRGGSPGDSMMF